MEYHGYFLSLVCVGCSVRCILATHSHAICYRLMQSDTGVMQFAKGWCKGVLLQLCWNPFQNDLSDFHVLFFLQQLAIV